MLIACLITLFIGSAVCALIFSTWDSQAVISGQNYVDTAARTPIDALADNLRNAQANPSAGYAALAAASASDVTLYTGSSGSTARYWLNGGNLTRTDAGGTATIMDGVSALTLTYYSSSGPYIAADSNNWTASSSPSDLAKVAAVKIQATVSVNGYGRTITSLVRLRNSPHKTVDSEQ